MPLVALSVLAAPGFASARQASPAPGEPVEAMVRAACSQCHAWPPPHVLPRDAWPGIVEEMNQNSVMGYGLGGELGDLWRYDQHAITRYYLERAPDALAPPEPWPPPGEAAGRFTRRGMTAEGATGPPGTSNVRFLDMDGDERAELVVCDMRNGAVFLGRPYEREPSLELLARVPNPAHAARVDLDRDGRPDLLVADLGGLLPADHERGSVVWLRQTEPGAYEARTLVAGLPRVADAEAADFDGDGDHDLVVAAFGWRRVGSIVQYETRSQSIESASFREWPVDARAGAIHVPIADLDGDGRPDFVALLSQQHERVVAFLNQGPGRGFRPRTLFAGPYPSWGASGIELTDLDRDGDLDVLLTNGDTLDDQLVKPYHGIRWLENTGDFPWVEHELAALPGVHRAQAADLDGDGDMDVVAAAFLAAPGHADLASLIWLEQLEGGAFRRHTLEAGGLRHATLDLGDFDLDGDVDIAVGNLTGHAFDAEDAAGAPESLVEIWENQGLGSR